MVLAGAINYLVCPQYGYRYALLIGLIPFEYTHYHGVAWLDVAFIEHFEYTDYFLVNIPSDWEHNIQHLFTRIHY